jgi:uncharacterized membrane protein YuzA (DUF378 family)
MNETKTIIWRFEMKTIDVIVGILLIVGGLNWGLVGLANFDLVKTIFGDMSILSRIVYIVVGLGAFYLALQMRVIPQRWAISRQ